MARNSSDLLRSGVSESGPCTLLVTLRARPDRAETLKQELIALTELTRREPGILAYNVHRDRTDRDLFVCYETYANMDVLKTHQGQPYVQAFIARQHDWLEGNLEVRWLSTSVRHPGA